MATGASASHTGYLEQFLLLVKDTTGKATSAIVQRVLKHKQIFVFGELVDAPSVAQLKGSSENAWYEVLLIFAYGTYMDYKAKKGSLPSLSAEQLEKLKMLSIVAMASKKKLLSYDLLLSELDVSSVRELEDLVISCIYNNILRAKLNQRARSVEIQWALGRDIHPDEIQTMTDSIKAWTMRAEQMLRAMEGNIDAAISDVEHTQQENAALEEEMEKVRKKLQNGGGQASKRDGFDDYSPQSMIRRALGGSKGKSRPGFGGLLRGGGSNR